MLIGSDVMEEKIADADTEIRLTHPKLEHSTNVHLMLDLLYDKLVSPLPITTLWRLTSLIPLLQKYELDTALLKLKKILKKASGDSTPGKIVVFISAAQLPSIDICTSCIRNGGRESWKEVLRGMEDEVEEEIGIERDMRASSTFDVKSWSERISTKVPGKAMSALWKAEMGMLSDEDEEDLSAVEWDAIADKFRESS